MKNKTIQQIGRFGMALAVALGTGSAPVPLPAAASAPQRPVEAPLAAPLPALVLAPQAISLSLQAPANPLSPIRTFTVDVVATGVTNLGAWEFDLAFDQTFFDVVELTAQPAFGQETNCNPATTRCAYTLGPWVDGNVASVGGLTYGAGPTMSANGVVGRMKLQPRGKTGTTTITITQPLATNAAGDNQVVTGNAITLVFAGAVNRVFLPSAQRTGAELAQAEQESAKPVDAPKSENSRNTPATATPYCAPYDVRCDGFIDVRDLQTQANLFGAVTGTLPYSPALDLDGNGVINADDLLLNAGGWHSTPQQLAGGPPRLGYAVSITGAVFLRWTLPITPYVASVYVIRQDISGTTSYTPVVAGVVDPIYNEPLALSLLGTNWDTLRQLSFTTDISGVTTPATFTSVLAMHQAFAQNKGNLLAVSQLINTEPGVALVMGRGFIDANRQTPISKFWIRVKGRLLGPVTVDRTGRTVEPAPQSLTAFDASGYITTTDLRERANQQRFADGMIFLRWRPPVVGQYNPVWMFGYDVFRKACNPLFPNVCGNTEKVNPEPVTPRTNTRAPTQSVPITGTPGASLRFSGDVSDINFSYADRNLDPDVLYCYKVAARDLLGQSGALSEEACLRGPDFRGPVAPQPVYAAATEADGDVCEINLLVAWRRDSDAARYEIWRGTPPSGTAESTWVLLANVTQTNIAVSTTTNFDLRGGYAYTRYNNAGNLIDTRPVNWRLSAQFNAGQTLLSNRLVFTNTDPNHPTLTLTPTLVFTGSRSAQQGDKQARFDARQLLYFIDTTVSRGDRFRYRVVPYDARGNLGAPSAPAEMIARQKPGECLPEPPTFGNPVNDKDVATVNLYRKFGAGGQPVLVSRMSRQEWNSSSMTITDPFSPTVEMEVSYELRAENGYGEVSLPGSLRTRLLTPPLLRSVPVAQPIIADAKIAKAGGKFQATVDWVSNDNTSGSQFLIYMSRGMTEPTSYLSMTLVHSGTAPTYAFTKTSVYSNAAGTGNVTITQKVLRHSFDNDDLSGPPKLNGKDMFWFMVGARSRYTFIGVAPRPSISSTLRPAKYVARVDEPERDTDAFSGSRSVNALQTSVSVERSGMTDDDYAECCYVVFRSRDGATNWTQLTKPFVGFDSLIGLDIESSYSDQDDSLFDPTYTAYFNPAVYYKIVKLDAGFRGSIAPFAINLYNVTGEVVEASQTLSYTFTNSAFPGTNNSTAGANPPGSLPAATPKVIDFGGILVDVITTTRMIPIGVPPSAWQGEGSVLLRNNTGNLSRVKVDFSGVTMTLDNPSTPTTATVTGLRASGYANVLLGSGGECYRSNRSNRVKYRVCDVTLSESGMAAGQLILDALGADYIPWDVEGGVGFSDIYTFNNVALSNTNLDWTKIVTPSNTCGGPIADQGRVATHADWPLLIYPTGPMTYTERSVVYSTVCTQHRGSRDTGLNQAGEALDSLDYDNNGFLEPNYTSSNARWSASTGLTGTFSFIGVHSYTLAMPFRMKIKADDWRFRFENGLLTNGHIRTNGVVEQPYFNTNTTNAPARLFTGTFGALTLGPNGAIWGDITGTVPLTWTTFSFTGTSLYQLYAPPALTPDLPEKSWLAERGDPASGLDPTGLSGQQKTENGGINVFKRGLTWMTCAATGGADGPVTFESSASSGFRIYFRYGGATGQVNMPVTTGYKSVTLSGYETRITRLSQSWLDGVPYVGATLGDLFIPFPVSITLQMAGMTMNNDGCMSGGPVLPIPSRLQWWQTDVTPQAAEWRRGDGGATSIWLVGEYEIPNLTRVDGVVNGTTLDDPTVPMEMSFKPNGDFGAANAYPQPTVYEIDGFYSVIEQFSLSDCNPKMANGNPPANRNSPIARCDGPSGASPWNANVTFRPAPTATNQISAYVDIVGSMVFPWFGEVISPSANHIYLLQAADYIGFDKRPKLDSAFSKLLPIGVQLDLTFAQGKNKDGAWIGIAKQGAQRDALLAFSAPYAAVITPDNTTLVFGFPAMAAAMLGAQQMECDWDAARCNDASSFADWNNKWSNFRTKLGVNAGAYDGEYNDARRLADAVKDQKATLTAYNLLDAVELDLEATCAATACTDEEIAAWMDNTVQLTATPHARSALLRGFMAQSPLQVQWLRGSVSILGVRDDDGRLISGKVGTLHLDSYLTVFNRGTSEGASVGGTTPMFDALVSLDIDVTNNSFRISANGIDVKLVGNPATMNIDLEIYMGDPNGYGAHGSIELLNLHLALMDINEADADFGFTIKNGNLDELYLGVTFEANVQTGAFGRILVGGQFLVGRLDPDHPTLQEDFGDLFDDMNTNGNVIEGMYLSVYANNIPIVSIAGCLVAELSGGGGLAFWVFTDPAQNDTAWGTRVSGFVQGQGGACLVALAVNIDLTLDNGFGEDETKITGDLFVAGGCGFCEPEEWITEQGYENDKGCIKCGLNLGFIIPLDGSPAPYMVPEPQFSCSL